MKIFTLSDEHLATGWVTGRYSVKIPPKIPGLTAAFFVKAFFQIKPGEKPTPCEKIPPGALSGDLPIKEDPALGLGYASDFVPYKPVADFTAVGTAYPPKRADAHFPVRMRVGDRVKELKVFGPWKWQRMEMGLGEKPGVSAPPVPVPITYSNAWGGPNYPLNPLGCGREGERTHLLERPDAYITHREFISGPAVLAPMPPDSPLRKSKMGTYDKEWVKTGWPWLPADFDYSYFNAAPPDQWMEGYLRGDEEVSFENMHPSEPLYQTRLPGIRVRCFVNRITNWKPDLIPEEAETAFEEVPLDLDTLWVDMDEEKMILVWRGRTPIRSFKRKDLENVLIITEPLGQPNKGLKHYHDLYLKELEQRPPPLTTRTPLDPEGFAAKHGIRSADSIREEVYSELKEAFTEASKEWDEGMRQVEQKLAKMDLIAPAEVTKARDAMAKTTAAGNPFANYLANPKVLPAPSPTDKGIPLDEILASMDKTLNSAKQSFQEALAAPGITPAAKTEILKKSQEMEASIGQGKVKAKDFAESMQKVEKEIEEKMAAHFPPRKSGEDFLKDGVPDVEKIRLEGLANTDLDGFDFSGLDLSGVDFSGAKLNEALFVGANLKGANFSNATMMEADLTRADLSGAILDHVNLSTCKVMGACWSGASLTMASLTFLKLPGADFSKAKGEKADFTGADLSGADFRESTFTLTFFTNALVEGANFSRATLTNSSFIVARGEGIVMTEADLTRVAGGFGADFTGGRFQRVNAEGSSWGESVFTGADFHQANLRGAIFSDAKLQEAHLDRCDLRGAFFDDALLQRAVLTHCNLMQSSFDRADLTEAHLERSNLYGCSFWESILLKARWEGANLKGTSLEN